MRVTQQEARRILEGRKTQHRFLVVEEARVVQRKRRLGGRRGPLVSVPSESPAVHQPFEPRLGGMLTVSAPGMDPVRVQITHVARETLGKIEFRDVLAEGHKTTDLFKGWWIARHDREWAQREPDPVAWLKAPYGRHHADRRLQQLEDVIAGPLARFDTRWAHREVWTVTFRRDTAHGFLGIAIDGHGDEHGYTTSPSETVLGIDEVVEPATLQRYADRGREFDAMRRAGVAEILIDRLRALDAEIVEWKHQGQANGFNLRSQVKRLQQARDGIEREIRQQISRRQRAA